MNNRLKNGRAVAFIFGLAGALLATHLSGQLRGLTPNYKVLAPTIEGNLAVFPVVSIVSHETGMFLTLDEGIRSGEVVVREAGEPTGFVRPRLNSQPSQNDGVWRERPYQVPRRDGAQVNELVIVNGSAKPLLLLAGEIVTGGKQDRIVAKDLIIPAHSQPVALGVFCVEPHRWTSTSSQFSSEQAFMAQPSLRVKAMVEHDQAGVWNEVAKSRSLFIAAAPQAEAHAMQSTSSYAATLGSDSAQRRIDSIAAPLEHSYDKFLHQLREQKALGAVISVNGELIWADAFASTSLLEKYWPKLIRSYAAEAVAPKVTPAILKMAATQEQAQNFMNQLDSTHETIESEPGIYRTTEISSADFTAYILTSLLPDTGFNVHVAKMKHQQSW